MTNPALVVVPHIDQNPIFGCAIADAWISFTTLLEGLVPLPRLCNESQLTYVEISWDIKDFEYYVVGVGR